MQRKCILSYRPYIDINKTTIKLCSFLGTMKTFRQGYCHKSSQIDFAVEEYYLLYTHVVILAVVYYHTLFIYEFSYITKTLLLIQILMCFQVTDLHNLHIMCHISRWGGKMHLRNTT